MKNILLICACALLVGCHNEVGRYQISGVTTDPVMQRSASRQEVIKLDTVTGRSWVFLTGVTNLGNVFTWIEVPTSPDTNFFSTHRESP